MKATISGLKCPNCGYEFTAFTTRKPFIVDELTCGNVKCANHGLRYRAASVDLEYIGPVPKGRYEKT